MSEYVALEKNSCPACGAQAEWNPTKQALICPYCGTESPYELNKKTGNIEEIDLVKTLREMPEELRGWQAKKKSVRCRSCRAVSVFDPEKVGKNCDFCGSPELVDYEELKPPIRPQSLLPFKISETNVRDRIRKWYSSRWFAPNKLKKRALVDTVHGVYLPYWTFDAKVFCRWTADSGYYYYTTETYRDSSGKTRTRQVRKVRWEPSSGSLHHFFDDELVSGSKGVRPELLRQIEPFPTRELVNYDKGFLSGFVVEHYQVVLLDAAKTSMELMNRKLYQICAGEVPGDTFRNLQIEPDYSDKTFKHVLAPVWLLVYNYGTKAFQVVVNGFTGQIAGDYPKSIWKILLLIVSILLALTLIIVLSD